MLREAYHAPQKMAAQRYKKNRVATPDMSTQDSFYHGTGGAAPTGNNPNHRAGRAGPRAAQEQNSPRPSSSCSSGGASHFSRTLDALDLDWRAGGGSASFGRDHADVEDPYFLQEGYHSSRPNSREHSKGAEHGGGRTPSKDHGAAKGKHAGGHQNNNQGATSSSSGKVSPQEEVVSNPTSGGSGSKNRAHAIKSKSSGNLDDHGGEEHKPRQVDNQKTPPGKKLKAKKTGWRYNLVTSKRFELVIGAVICVNAICMGIEYQLSESDLDDFYFLFQVLDLFFLIIFTWELSLRFSVFGVWDVVKTPIYTLDCFIVGAGLITELVLPLMAGTFMSGKPEGKNDMVKLIRSCRALRALRVLRVITLIESLWVVVELFFYSLPPLFWTVVFIMIIIFLFTIFTIVLVGRSNMGGDAEIKEAQAYFGTTRDSFVYLFQIMTLDGWVDLVQPIGSEHPWAYAWFLLFISITSFSLMNLVTVSVLETARSAQAESLVLTDIRTKMEAIHDLYAFPGDLGETTREYFVANWRSSKTFTSVFQQLNLDDKDAAGFFDALDLDGSGGLDHFELSTTYMELVTNVLNTPSLVALIRSASESDERSRLLRSTMERSQQQRVAEEQRQAMETLQETVERFQREMFELLPGMIRKELAEHGIGGGGGGYHGYGGGGGGQMAAYGGSAQAARQRKKSDGEDRGGENRGGGPMTAMVLRGVPPAESARQTNTAPDYVI
eukprot:g11258.t1